MQTTFFHRLVITLVASLGLALLIEFYRNVIVESERSMSSSSVGGPSKKPGVAPRPRR